MNRNRVKDAYFEWLLDLVCEGRNARRIHYRRLFTRLQETDFTYSIPMDGNRAEDGIELRYKFGRAHSIDDAIIKDSLGIENCSLLEMMVALSVRCEDEMMSDFEIGNRTGVWFWSMIQNLGLATMSDLQFNEAYVGSVINRLLNREYGPHGEGGLFTVTHRPEDMRKVDIWYQMCWHLVEI